MGEQAAGDPSTKAQHPEDTELEPRVHPSRPCPSQDIPASLIYGHSFSLS